jgi:hypothetical protein
MAESVHADMEVLSASKRLFNTKDERYKKVLSLMRQQKDYWFATTVPYPENGVRLIRSDSIADFERRLASLSTQLDDAVVALNTAFDQLKESAEQQLGELWNPSDYPASLVGAFETSVEYPSLDPDPRLIHVDPQLYERELERVRQRFDAAVADTESEFKEQFSECVSHLVDKLSTDAEGKSKIFRNSAIENLKDFFGRFRMLNLHSDDQFDVIVNQAEQLLDGVKPDALRKDTVQRESIRREFASVKEKLEQFMIDRPERMIEIPE